LGGSKAVFGGFDSHALPPSGFPVLLTNTPNLLTDFLNSRRQGLSPRSIEYYRCYLNLARQVVGIDVPAQRITQFLGSLTCSDGGKHAYYRTLRAFYNWLYSPKSGYNLNPQKNPILLVEAPKVGKKILPSLSQEQVEYLIEQAGCVRDKAIISLFVDSGLRLSELANIKPENIDWENRLIKVVCKGNKEGLAPFGERTEKLMREWLSQYQADGRLWDLKAWGIIEMLKVLKVKTGLPCNAHTFRRTFASLLRKAGLDSMAIKDLGRWESITMVERYTRSVTFQDSLKFYKAPLS
jgi:site-specific recombinase XerD